MFASKKLTMAARPTGMYQMGSELVVPSSFNGEGIALSGAGNVVAMFYSESIDSRVVVRRWDGSAWVQVGADVKPLGLDGRGEGEISSVSLNSAGDVLVIGTPVSVLSNGSARGRVHVYRWNGSAWVLKGSPIQNPSLSSWKFGTFVGVSADGNRLVQGCADATQAAGIVSVHSWGGSSWSLQRTIAGGSMAGDIPDRTGVGASISSDGSVVVFGRETDDGAGEIVRFEGSSPAYSFYEPTGQVPDSRTYNPASVNLSGDGRTMSRVRAGFVSGDVVVPPDYSVYGWSGSSWSKIGDGVRGVLNHDGSVIVGGGVVWRRSGSSWIQKGDTVSWTHPQFGVIGAKYQAVSHDGTVVAHGTSFGGQLFCRVYRWN